MSSKVPALSHADAIKRVETLYEALRDTLGKRTCVECEHWSKASQLCTVFDARPPAEVIVVGCHSWVLRVPF